MKQYMCIDIGGTAIKYGRISSGGKIEKRGETATHAEEGGSGIVRRVKTLAEGFQKEGGFHGICISTAGMVDIEKGEIFYSAPLIPNYAGTKWKALMEEQFGVPCEVENDVNCAGLSEQISGAAMGSRVTLCLTVGTGIGGCILIDGKVFHGFSSSACEVGYMHMLDSDFQTLGSSRILCKRVAEKKGASVKEWNGRMIFEAAKQGDTVCTEAIDEMADVLGRGIANICYVINPEVVVLGGGIMAQEEYLKPRIEKALCRYLIPSIADRTRLVMAQHRNDAGMLGAFYHFQIRQGLV